MSIVSAVSRAVSAAVIGFQLGVHNPWGGPGHRAHKPQCAYLDVDRAAHKGISQTHFIGGRGSAKTTTGILLAARTAFCDMPGVPGFWSEPRGADLFKVFLREWERIVPERLYEFTSTRGVPRIQCKGGTVIDMISRKVDKPNDKVGIGPNYGWGINDEAAEKCQAKRLFDMRASIRLPSAPFRFHDTLSTPVRNAYYAWCSQPGARQIHSSSYDNPFIRVEDIEVMKAGLPPGYVAQEIMGQWIELQGRVFENFDYEHNWPRGSIHPTAKWDKNRPWFLGLDLGAGIGHWQIWQWFAPHHPETGELVYPSSQRIAVVVAEGLQYQQAIHPVLQLIADKYAQNMRPAIVCVGTDVKRRGETGPAPIMVIKQRGWDVWYPTEELTDASLRVMCLDRAILNTAGERRFCVAKHIERHGPPDQPWGVKHAMQIDSWPDPGSTIPFRKDKRVAGISAAEDARDSTTHLAAHQFRPDWREHDRWAA